VTTGHNGDDGRSYFSGFLLRHQRIGTRGHLTRSRRAKLNGVDSLTRRGSQSATELADVRASRALGTFGKPTSRARLTGLLSRFPSRNRSFWCCLPQTVIISPQSRHQ
jgi:hypothetical protein